MVNPELNRQLKQLRELIDKTREISTTNPELISHWARYVCVIIAGFLENAIEEIFGDYARNSSSGPVGRFATRMLVRFQNPKAGRFVEVAYHFKPEWGSQLETYLKDNGRGDAIDSIMTNRNNIVHGRVSGITIARDKEYLDKSLEVLEFIEGKCLGKTL